MDEILSAIRENLTNYISKSDLKYVLTAVLVTITGTIVKLIFEGKVKKVRMDVSGVTSFAFFVPRFRYFNEVKDFIFVDTNDRSIWSCKKYNLNQGQSIKVDEERSAEFNGTVYPLKQYTKWANNRTIFVVCCECHSGETEPNINKTKDYSITLRTFKKKRDRILEKLVQNRIAIWKIRRVYTFFHVLNWSLFIGFLFSFSQINLFDATSFGWRLTSICFILLVTVITTLHRWLIQLPNGHYAFYEEITTNTDKSNEAYDQEGDVKSTN
jgi:hypothetical protein